MAHGTIELIADEIGKLRRLKRGGGSLSELREPGNRREGE